MTFSHSDSYVTTQSKMSLSKNYLRIPIALVTVLGIFYESIFLINLDKAFKFVINYLSKKIINGKA